MALAWTRGCCILPSIVGKRRRGWQHIEKAWEVRLVLEGRAADGEWLLASFSRLGG
jgi:hypothetical protein